MRLLTVTILVAAFSANAVVLRNEDARSLKGSNHTAFEWGACDPTLVQDLNVSCSFFEIPLDYHNSEAGTGRLAVAKVNATGERLGTVFFNPGGPGASGLAAMNEASTLLLALTGGNYDIVSWDTRGVGTLTIPGDIVCFDNVTDYNTFWNGTIELDGIEYTGNFTDPADTKALLAQATVMGRKYAELGKRCQQHPTGKYMKYIGTAATVRDMIALADALDGPGSPVNYAGISYGTLLGAWFVNMFPKRVGRVLLDGVLNPQLVATQESHKIWPQQLSDTDKAYEAFVAGCALAGPSGCAIATANASAADVDATIKTLLQQAHDATRKNASVPVTSADIRSALLSAMYFPATWADLANTTFPEIVAAVQGESLARRALGGVAQRIVRRHQSDEAETYGGIAVACSDSIDPRGTSMKDVFKNTIAATQSVNGSHLFTPVWPISWNYCPFWPVRAVERYTGPFNKKLANKVLIANNRLDAATPLKGAQALSKIMGDNAALVVQEGIGHTTLYSPSQCMNEILFTYMTTGAVPDSNDTTCEVDTDFELFDGVNTEAIMAALAT
ncbi:alpha/beta-hydrolase [Trametes versicolor FP-101664 SS1]|uniref:alpha/beta-hydrolase n=1 Tax=Trametes versicolor (strain FP-101664) TaxID=717944 RepID=UPI000462208F|nr:alpha/beta-hydrolase [Trametes versicolor FP-101664 SS1]EIW56310.1 alpha/beta-hydrolase [Trametes versicolor FP-101664 SS1]